VFTLLAIALGAGLLAGLLARGRVTRLREVRMRAMPVLFAGLVLGIVPLFATLSKGPRLALQIVSMLCVLAYLALNAAANAGGVRAGFCIIGLGWALNFVVIAANGGMPLSRWAYERSGQSGAVTPGKGGFFKIVVAGPHTTLRALGDVIPVRAVTQVLSAGDIVLIAGIAIVIAAGMRARAPEPVRA
jgi:hypothetical protein